MNICSGNGNRINCNNLDNGFQHVGSEALVNAGYLRYHTSRDGKFPVLRLTEKSRELLMEDQPFMVVRRGMEGTELSYMDRVIAQGSVQAYQPWTEEEDQQLLQELEDCISIRDIAVIHQRTYGAIRKRLMRLGKL